MINKSKWTSEEDKFLRENYKKLKPAEIGRQLNRTENAITRRAHVLGIKRATKHAKWTKAEDKKLENIYDDYSMRQLSEILDKTENQIRTRAQKLGIYGTKYKVVETSVPEVKKFWTKEERADVISRLKKGESSKKIAKKYKTTKYDIESVYAAYKEIAEHKDNVSKKRAIEKYNLNTYSDYIISKMIIDKNTVFKKKRASIIAMYDYHFVVETENNIKESINYVDLIVGDYVIKEVA